MGLMSREGRSPPESSPPLRGLLGIAGRCREVLAERQGGGRCQGGEAQVGPGLDCGCDSTAHHWDMVLTAGLTKHRVGGSRSILQMQQYNV